MPDPNYVTPEEVIARYRGTGKRRNSSQLALHADRAIVAKIGKAIHYPSGELDR